MPIFAGPSTPWTGRSVSWLSKTERWPSGWVPCLTPTPEPSQGDEHATWRGGAGRSAGRSAPPPREGTGYGHAVVQRALSRVSTVGVGGRVQLPRRRRHGVRGHVPLREGHPRPRAPRRHFRSERSGEGGAPGGSGGARARDHAYDRLSARRRDRVRRGGRPRERRLDAVRSGGTVARAPRGSAGIDSQHRALCTTHRLVRRRQRPHLGAGVRLRRRRGLPAVPRARRARVRWPRRPSAHRRVDRCRVGALEAGCGGYGGWGRLEEVFSEPPQPPQTSSNLPNLHQPPRGESMRAVLTLGFTVLLATPAAAQWLGEPVWNSPKAGTGVTISGDYGKPDSTSGKGNAFGGRVSLGLSTITFTAGVATWKPDGATQSFTSIGGNAAFRLIGGSLLPVAVNLQVGAARTDSANSTPAQTAVTGAAGFSVPLPTPGISIEPYFSPGIRYHSSGGTNSTEFGYVFGANLSFGLVGMHVAYDNEKLKGGGSRRV